MRGHRQRRAPTGTANTIVTLSAGKYGAQSYLIQVKLDPAAGSSYTNADQLADPTSAAYATALELIRDAIRLHVEARIERGEPVYEQVRTSTVRVEV